MLMAWTPSQCTTEASGVVCRLPDALSRDVSGSGNKPRRNATRFQTSPPGPPAFPAPDWRAYVRRLPWLSFRMRADGPMLRVPLATLLYARDADADSADSAGSVRHSENAHRR